MTAALIPVVVAVVLIITDSWVYLDAKRHEQRGDPIIITIGAVQIDTPWAWFLCCLILWIVSFPLYLTSRGRR